MNPEALPPSKTDFLIVRFDGEHALEPPASSQDRHSPVYGVYYRPYLFSLAGFGAGALGALVTGNSEQAVNFGAFGMIPTSAASYLLGILGLGD